MDDKANLQKQLASIEAFMQTPAYGSYIFTIETDIAGIRESILMTPPVDQSSISNLLLLHGNLQTLNSNLSIFKDSCDVLKAKLDAMVESEQPIATTNNQ